jgi:phage repressor protein C with HTH and peptisase S24 domain
MVDTSVRVIAHDGIYVLADAERVRVRRVSPRTGHWLLISDNASYPPEIVPDEVRLTYSVLGRAVFAFRCAPL